MMYRSEQSI